MKGHLKEFKPGTYYATVDLPRGEDGKRRQKRVTIYASGIRDAHRQFAIIRAEAITGNIAAPSKLTVETYLNEWLEKRTVDGLSPKTIETWRDLSRAYIFPEFGKTVLEKVTPRQVERFYTKLLTSGRKRDGKGLSRRTVLHIHRLLSEVLKSAVRLQLIPRNPCDGCGPKNVFHDERTVVRDFNEECVRKLLAGVEDSWVKIPVLLGIAMGMRRGECLALTWADVDFDAATLKIDKNLLHLRSQSPIVKRPKRDRTRQAMMPDFLIAALRRHRGQQAAHRLQIGPAWEDNDLVCPNELGQRRSPNSLSNTFGVTIDRLGLPDITFHDLRHLNATLLLLAGVPDKVVAERLGHSDTRITRDLYQHVLPAMDQEAAKKTDDFFRRVAG